MPSMRELMSLTEGQIPYDPNMGKLADLVAEWIEIDPFYSVGYASAKKRIATQIIGLTDLAMKFKAVPVDTLWRAYGLNGKSRKLLFSESGLTITPRPSDMLASWTMDSDYAYDHASQYEDAILIRYPTNKLNIFMNLDAFSKSVGGLQSIESEILVKPQTITITRHDIEQPD